MPPPRLPPSNSTPRSNQTPIKKKRRNSQIPRTVKSNSVLLPPTPTGAKSVASFSPTGKKGNISAARSSTAGSPLEQKIQELNDILSQPEIDLWALRELCLSDGGLVNDAIRKKAWPKLVGIVHSKQTPISSLVDSKPQLSTIVPTSLSVVSPESVSSFKNSIVASCIDAVQISLDTARCTWHLLNGTQRANKNTMRNKHKKRVRALLKRKQRRLGNFINLTLIRTYDEHTKLRYYQGYHDVSCIILSVLGGETTVPPSDMDKHPKTVQAMATKTAQAMGLDLPSEVLAKLSHSHFVDLMKDNFEHLTKALRLIVFPLMACLDPEVHQHLLDCDMEPFFCLSWIITWFSHDVRDTAVVKRLFDFFIASHPIMPVYMSIAMVLHPVNRMEVLSSGCDFASLHRTLSQLPMNSCSVGWKFIGSPAGGEYVSGEEDDDDNCSFDGSILSQDVYREEGGGCGDDDSLAPSLASESMLSGCCDSSRVPFQEVIDMAIKFMRRIPPRRLIRLAHRYYDSETIQQLAGNADKINMLQRPPEWATSATIMSDDAAKKVYRYDNCSEDKDFKKGELSQEMKYIHAVIAAGIGPDGDGDAIKRKKRRKIVRTSAIIVGIASVLLGMVERQVLISPFKFSVTKADANYVGSISRRSDFYPSHHNYKSPGSNMKTEDYTEDKPLEFDVTTSMDLLKFIEPNNKDSFHYEEFDVHLNAESEGTLQETEASISKDTLDRSNQGERTSAQALSTSELLLDKASSKKSNPLKIAFKFVRNNKLKPMELGQQLYKEAKSAIRRIDSNVIRHYITNEVTSFAKTTKEALAEEADILLL